MKRIFFLTPFFTISLLIAGCDCGDSETGFFSSPNGDSALTDGSGSATKDGAQDGKSMNPDGSNPPTDGGIKKENGGTNYTDGGKPKDSTIVINEAGVVLYKETGPVVINEAGVVLYKETGPVVINEAGVVLYKETGPVVINEAGVVLYKDSGGVIPDHSIYTDGGAPIYDSSIYADAPIADAATAPKTDYYLYIKDALPPVDQVVGKTDGGKYLCQTISGTGLCECNDGIDNDKDGQTDYPNDKQCASPYDTSESDTACSNGIDDDGDKLIDLLDPECTGPLDDDENSYATGIPGDNKDACKQDCFFDGNSGSGDDKCEWNLFCSPTSLPGTVPKQCVYDTKKAANPSQCPTSQKEECLNKCLQVTPNGCDCFGCCTITYGGTTKNVFLSPTCTVDQINDPTKCIECTPSTDCVNPCGKCEVCIGKPAPDPSCFVTPDGGGGSGDLPWAQPQDACPTGVTYCGPPFDPSICPAGTSCLTGCCIPNDACC